MIINHPSKIEYTQTDFYLLKLQKIKSNKNIMQVNKLHTTLTSLEIKFNQQIANKYLVGFLEDKGVKSYDDYIDSLN